MIKEITDSYFTKKNKDIYINSLKKTGGLLIVKVDWCGHCRNSLIILEQVSKILGKNYPIIKLDADKYPKLTDELKVEGFPAIFYVNRDGKIGKRHKEERTVENFLKNICNESLICKKI